MKRNKATEIIKKVTRSKRTATEDGKRFLKSKGKAKPVKAKLSIPANVKVEPPTELRADAKPATLVILKAQYDFEPQPDWQVRVRTTLGSHATAYYLPASEARILWKRLIAKGAKVW